MRANCVRTARLYRYECIRSVLNPLSRNVASFGASFMNNNVHTAKVQSGQARDMLCFAILLAACQGITETSAQHAATTSTITMPSQQHEHDDQTGRSAVAFYASRMPQVSSVQLPLTSMQTLNVQPQVCRYPRRSLSMWANARHLKMALATTTKCAVPAARGRVLC